MMYLKMHFPVAHRLFFFFLFSVKHPIRTLLDLSLSGKHVTAARKPTPETLHEVRHGKSFIPNPEATEGAEDFARCLSGWQPGSFWLLSQGWGTFNHLGSGMI